MIRSMRPGYERTIQVDEHALRPVTRNRILQPGYARCREHGRRRVRVVSQPIEKIEEPCLALNHAILTALSHQPLSGYDLAREFRTSMGYFWRATRQQIYAELRRLEAAGMILGTRFEQERRPDKLIWSVMPAGFDELRSWLNTSSAPASIKEELLVKMYALDQADVDAVRRQLVERRRYHEERSALFSRVAGRLAPAGDTGAADLGRYLGASCGMRYELAMLSWCDDAITQLDELGART